MLKKDTVDMRNVGDADGVRLNAMKNQENVTLEKIVGNEEEPDNAKHDPERPAKICGCACAIGCNCNCTCGCAEHCVCRLKPCEYNCGARFLRNLVISIDGTSNQFGVYVSICGRK